MRFYLATENNFKYDEVKNLFKNYGLMIKRVKNLFDVLEEEKSYIDKDYAVLREETYLLRDQAVVNTSDLVNLDMVSHISDLKVDTFKNKKLISKSSFKSSVDGFIDLNRRKKTDGSISNVYNWDDIFVELETMKTYQEMKNKTNKFSSRTKVISEYIDSIITFEQKIDLNFNPMNQDNVLSFSNEIYELIDKNEYLSKHKNNPFLSGLILNIKSEGLFTRSSINKNQRNYWYPSLNAGLPLVPKKDEIHEVTFMFHDLMHHAMPDLILNGDDSSSVKETYIIHRMLSEAITIVLADMIFVDELVTSGYEYNWSKRRIYPIYEEFKKGGVSLDRIKELVWANIEFALLGDESALVKLSNKEVVLNYKEKYEKFFIEDYRWTVNNYESMMSSKDALSSWYKECSQMIPSERIVYTYSDLLLSSNEDKYSKKVNVIFEEMWSMLIKKMDYKIDFDVNKANKKAFTNYMIGQMFIFFKLEKNENSKIFFKMILDELNTLESVKMADVKRIRQFFNIYLEKLNKRNIITDIEFNNYKEIVPLFETFFVFYERELKYNSIEEVINKLMIK